MKAETLSAHAGVDHDRSINFRNTPVRALGDAHSAHDASLVVYAPRHLRSNPPGHGMRLRAPGTLSVPHGFLIPSCAAQNAPKNVGETATH